MGDVGDATVTTAIQKLKNAVSYVLEFNPEYGNPLFLFPFLKQYRFNVQRAAEGVRASIKWRNEIDMETLTNIEMDSEVLKMIPLYNDCVARDGSSIWSIKIGGTVDHRGIVEKFGREQYRRFFIQMIGKLEKNSMNSRQQRNEWRKTKTDPVGATLVVDFSNYTFYQARGINVNKLFAPIFKIIKPLLEGPCLELKVFNMNDIQWEQELLKKSDLDQLRPIFGGTKID